MAWETNPTFTDGDILTAAKLNTLTNNLDYLEGRGNAPNLAVLVYRFTITATAFYWRIHKYRYLHYNYYNPDGTDGLRMKLIYNGTEVHNQSPVLAGTAYTGSIDLDSLGLTVGNNYIIQAQYTKDSAEPGVLMRMLEERDVA